MIKNTAPNQARFFLKNAKRFSVLGLTLTLALGAIAALSLYKLQTEYSMKQFLPENHPLILADDKAKERFQLPEIEPVFALITLGAKEPGTWLEAKRIENLRTVTEDLKKLDPGVESTVSIATVEGASDSKEGITIGKLLALTPEPKWQTRVLDDPILTPRLITKDGRTAMLAITMKHLPTKQSQAIQDEARLRLAKIFPEATIKLGGVPAVQSEMNSILGQELKNFLFLSVLASLITLFLFFRTISSVAIPLVLLVLANTLSLAWMAWAGVAFTVLSTTLPVLVAITVVSMSTHTMLRFASDWQLATRTQENPNPLRVLFRSYSGLLMPNTLTAITTAVGFLAVAITNVPLIRQYGITVGISIFVCWLVVISTLLPLLILFPIPKARSWTESRARWSLLFCKYQKATLLTVGVLCAGLLWKGSELNWSARLFDDLPKNKEARSVTEFVDSSLGGMIPFDLVIEGKEENTWNDPAAIAQLDALANKWRKDPRVGSVVGPEDFLRAIGKVQGKGLPASRQETAENIFLYTFAEENPLKHHLTTDGRAAMIFGRVCVASKLWSWAI